MGGAQFGSNYCPRVGLVGTSLNPMNPKTTPTPGHPLNAGPSGTTPPLALTFTGSIEPDDATALREALETFSWAGKMLEVHPASLLLWHIDEAAKGFRDHSKQSWLPEWSNGALEFPDDETRDRVRARVNASLAGSEVAA